MGGLTRQAMPVDYSKWDKLDLSDDEGEATTSVAKAPAKKAEPVASVRLEKPKEAQGSAWNANNYHFEEQKLDVWGRARLKEFLKAKAKLEIEHAGQTFRWSWISESTRWRLMSGPIFARERLRWVTTSKSS